MKVLIAADMEGITGVTDWEHVIPGKPDYNRFRKLMTGDVNAAIEGCFVAGADQVIVSDGHAFSYNILIEELDKRAILFSGNSSPYSMIQGIEQNVDCAIFIGYHAKAGTTNAILDHTWSSKRIQNLYINNEVVGETALNAALSAHFNVPVIMVTGDQAVCKEAEDRLGNIETVTVKKALGRSAAACLTPTVTHEAIYNASKEAIRRFNKGDFIPQKISTPITVRIDFATSQMAELASQLLRTSRIAARSIQFESKDMTTAYVTFQAVVLLAE
jgi:D-amino peptidase